MYFYAANDSKPREKEFLEILNFKDTPVFEDFDVFTQNLRGFFRREEMEHNGSKLSQHLKEAKGETPSVNSDCKVTQLLNKARENIHCDQNRIT